VKLIIIPMKDPERERIANESLIADLLGEEPVAVPRSSTVDPKVAELLRKFIHLSQVPHSFEALETMVKLYPWRGKISRGQHLENCYFLIAHETYILEERLKKFLKCIVACAAGRAFSIDMKAVTKGIVREHKSLFGNVVALRGAHVHEEATVPRDIKRIAELELQMRASDLGVLRYLHRDAVRKARQQWMIYAHNAHNAAALLIADTLQQTRVVWETVVKEQLDKLAAN
jgi:hypothetical protein